MKTAIIIITYHIDPRILIGQVQAIRKFCTDADYSIEFFDNSQDEEKAAGIKHHVIDQGCNYHRTISATTDPSVSHSFAANFAYKTLKDRYDLIAFFDHDLIPVKTFSVELILAGKLVAGVLQYQGGHVQYLWPGCLFLDNTQIDKSLVDFSPNNQLGTDTGGELYKLVNACGTGQCVFIDETGCLNPDLKDHPTHYFYMTLHNQTFLHFLAASGWAGEPDHEKRINSLINIVNNKITDYDNLQ